MNHAWKILHLAVLFSLIAALVGCSRHTEVQPFFAQDLRSFGFVTDSRGQMIGNFTALNFLSNDLLLVSVNTGVYGPVERANPDQPQSKLILFELSSKRVVRTKELPIERSSDSVRATHDRHFALLNESGLQICSAELECSPPVPANGPVFVSPEGTRIVVGGNGRTEQTLLDADSLKELEGFTWNNPSVIPGDGGLIVRYGAATYLRLSGKPDKLLTFGGWGVWPEARFLNRSTVVDFESDKKLAVAKTDGTIQYRVPVTARWNLSEIATSASGSRFCFHEAGYTKLNSIVNFLDIDSGRPLNIESVNVLSTESGKSLFELRWDPRPFVGIPTTPALSPDGHRLALIRNGLLEVFEVP